MPILGLHHVTATVDDAQDDLDFCLGGLGLRLVKKTVNFDNHHVYHFYYGDEQRHAGHAVDDVPVQGPRRAGRPQRRRPGDGDVVLGADRIARRLAAAARRARDRGHRSRRRGSASRSIRFADLSGLTFELIATDRDRARRRGSRATSTRADAVRGLHSVTLRRARRGEDRRADDARCSTTRVVDEMDSRIRLAVNGGGPGRTIDVAQHPDAEPAINGLGTVHHVAMAIATADEQLRLREELLRYGCKVTEVRDRCYFQSIYFREPGGVLFEVATLQPGFAIDEAPASLGRDLKLPPWEEPHRAEIERGLAPVRS